MFILDNGNSKLLFPFILIVFISVTMLFTSFDTYLVSAQPTENVNENFIPYENTDYGIKIQYPYNWKNVESLFKYLFVKSFRLRFEEEMFSTAKIT